MIPREHGAWAVLAVPMAIAAATEERVSGDFIVLAMASLAFFLAYLPVQLMLRDALGTRQPEDRMQNARSWGVGYLLTAGVLGVILLLRGFWLLAPIGVLGVAIFLLNFFLTRRRPKSIAGDLTAVTGLTLTGPAYADELPAFTAFTR